MRPLYVWIPVLIAAITVPLGYYYVDWSKSGEGAGLYSRDWSPEAIFAYWNPEDFYKSVESVTGTFSGEQCVACHQGVTPGVVNDWKKSSHSKPANAQPAVFCSDCHGSNHENLHMPTPDVCGSCHNKQHGEFVAEKRYGFPSHSLAMERALDAKHFADKPKAEVTACLQCHSVASKCDSCHTRHLFSAAEARRPEACITCHSGPPHPDDETYFNSKHGQLYLAEGENWDWSKPLKKGNYPAPTCAYCHMDEGKHQVADKPIHKFGIKQVNPLTSGNEIRRKQWVEMCADCHEEDWSADRLKEMDAERKKAWKKLYKAEDILKSLRSDNLIYPSAKQRPPYPMDTKNNLLHYERIGFFEGQASAFYNVSAIERDYFEMWYFDNLGAYKGSAHGDSSFVIKGHEAMDKSFEKIKNKAEKLRAMAAIRAATKNKTEKDNTHKSNLEKLWFDGEYTKYNSENN
ncbi:MAG: hydroxylamine oxidoreductase [Thiotrichaceae bacterium]|nr:MAG: hydroxylamine oxidoreductase [Thiotrichaceae bacterium]